MISAGVAVGLLADYFSGKRYLFTIFAVTIMVLGYIKALREEPTFEETIREALEQLKKKKKEGGL
jgi:hypothetical protein